MMKLFSVLSVAAISGVSAGGPLVLTSKNFEDEVIKSGKSSLIKFFAPWCGHCKAMKPTYDALADKYASDSSVNIADVDCTVEDKICSDQGVRGYPTIKYFNEATGFKAQDYNSGRDMDSLIKFVDENLSSPCSPSSTDKCTDKQKEYIEKMSKKEVADLEKELERLKKMGEVKVAGDKLAWLKQRKALLPLLIKDKEDKEEL